MTPVHIIIPARFLLIFCFTISGLFISSVNPSPSHGKAFFEDGLLGLTQAELREKLGMPNAVRSRKAALRVFHYYSLDDWEKYFSKLVSPENGEDVYQYEREGIQVRYSFVYTPDLREQRDFPTLYVKRVEIEFTPAVPMKDIPRLVPEFIPPRSLDAPAFRSDQWVLLLPGQPSKQAELIVKERDKEKWDWYLAYQMYSLKGIPPYVTLQVPVERLELTSQSLSLIKTLQRHTHETISNPFSPEFVQRPPAPSSPTKPIPRPQYAD